MGQVPRIERERRASVSADNRKDQPQLEDRDHMETTSNKGREKDSRSQGTAGSSCARRQPRTIVGGSCFLHYFILPVSSCYLGK